MCSTRSLVILEIAFDHSRYFYVHIEDIGYEHFNYGTFVCIEVLFDYGHGFHWVVRLFFLEALLDLILLLRHFLLEYFLLGALVLVDLLLSHILN